MDKRIKFYSHKTNILAPKPKSSFRHLKPGNQELLRKYVLVPADRTVCRLDYINTLMQELNGAKAYEENHTGEKTAVNSHSNDLPYEFAVNVQERQDYAFSHRTTQFIFRENFVSHLGGPNEQFGFP